VLSALEFMHELGVVHRWAVKYGRVVHMQNGCCSSRAGCVGVHARARRGAQVGDERWQGGCLRKLTAAAVLGALEFMHERGVVHRWVMNGGRAVQHSIQAAAAAVLGPLEFMHDHSVERAWGLRRKLATAVQCSMVLSTLEF
jgi:Fe2+ or Zn2+ uptake regulation protein